MREYEELYCVDFMVIKVEVQPGAAQAERELSRAFCWVRMEESGRAGWGPPAGGGDLAGPNSGEAGDQAGGKVRAGRVGSGLIFAKGGEESAEKKGGQ